MKDVMEQGMNYILCIVNVKTAMEQENKMRITEFEKKLKNLINSESRENDSNTADFILAEFMVNCLGAFELASNKREVWYGIELEPGCSVSRDDISGAVARGWCHKVNEKKTMDIDLGFAIVDEIIKILPQKIKE